MMKSGERPSTNAVVCRDANAPDWFACVADCKATMASGAQIAIGADKCTTNRYMSKETGRSRLKDLG